MHEQKENQRTLLWKKEREEGKEKGVSTVRPCSHQRRRMVTEGSK